VDIRRCSTRRTCTLCCLVLVGLAVVQADAARASSYGVNPNRVFLSPTVRSALLSLKNDADQPLRFQLSVMAWTESPRGEMQLAPTDDIIVFPMLLTLGKGEERKVRIGAATSFGTTEKTYRLFVEELVSAEKPAAPGVVTVLTKMGIPIFLEPANPIARASLGGLTLTDGVFLFQIQNSGTIHVLPQSVKVRGFDAQGEGVFEREAGAWYVLAGGLRLFEFPVPRPECERLRSLVVEVLLGDRTLKEQLETPSGACGR
jgi:fimbrial chaperone protein